MRFRPDGRASNDWKSRAERNDAVRHAAVMRVTAILNQTERKRPDRSVQTLKNALKGPNMTLPLRLIRPKPGRCATAAAIRGKKRLNVGQHQATIHANRTPLGVRHLGNVG